MQVKTQSGSKLILAPRSRSDRLISICPMVQEIVGHSGSLYLTEIGPERSSLMLVVKNTFFGTFIFSLLSTHIHKKFSIYWDLLDCVKKRHIQFDLTEHLEYLFNVNVLIVVPNPICKWCYRLVNLFSSCVLIRLLGRRLRGSSRCGGSSRINLN